MTNREDGLPRTIHDVVLRPDGLWRWHKGDCVPLAMGPSTDRLTRRKIALSAIWELMSVQSKAAVLRQPLPWCVMAYAVRDAGLCMEDAYPYRECPTPSERGACEADAWMLGDGMRIYCALLGVRREEVLRILEICGFSPYEWREGKGARARNAPEQPV